MTQTIYCISWRMFEQHDPERKTHIGPPLYRYDSTTAKKRPYTEAEANELARIMNSWATRAHHKAVVYTPEAEAAAEDQS